MAVSKRETFLVFIPVGIVAFFIAAAISATYSENKEKNETALAAGFTDSIEMESAKRAGFSEPVPWRAKIASEKLEREKADESRRIQAEKEAAKAAVETMERNRPATDRMAISGLSWEIGGFGSVALMSMTISNKNPFAVRDIGIVCTFDAKSGTEVSSVPHIIYDTIAASASKKFAKVNIGFIHSQSAKAGCRLASASRV